LSSNVGFPAAGGQVQLLELTDIRCTHEAWPRVDLDQERALEFCALYEAESEFALPPVEVISDPTGGFVLADGWHRVSALRALGVSRVRAVVLPALPGGDPVTAAYEHAVARSAISPKPLSRAEKQAAVIRLIELRPTASDREIGRLAGVDHKTVGRLRERGISPPADQQRARSAPSPEVAARKLLQVFERIREARGLGLADWWRGGDRTGHRLADVLLDVYGDAAREQARHCMVWLEQALEVLEQGDGAE
jgi:ParB-like chromosome segregation protein Spo0J